MRVNNRFYFISLLGFSFLTLWTTIKDRIFFHIFLGLFALLIIAYLIAYFSLRGVLVIRHSRIKNQEVGGIFEERFEVQNTSRLPKMWVELNDCCHLSQKINSRVIPRLKANSSVLFVSTMILNRRGYFPLGPTVLKSGDPFGFFSVEKTFYHEEILLVFPKIENLQDLPLPNSYKTGSQNLRVQTTCSTPQAAGVREYFPGDPLNRVHWPATLRHDRLMVKEFDEETHSCIWIFLDSQGDIYFRDISPMPAAIDRNLTPLKREQKYHLPDDGYEYAVSLAASLVKLFLKKNRIIGFISAAKELHLIQAEKGTRQLSKILEKLSILDADGNLTLQQLLLKQIRNIPKGSTLILITPRFRKDLGIMLEGLRRKGYPSHVYLIDNASFGGQQPSENPQMEILLSNMTIIQKGVDFKEAIH